MATITISIPDELKRKLENHPEVNWTEIIRRIFIKKVEMLKKAGQMEVK